MKLITLGSLLVSLLVINFLFRKTLGSIKKRNIILDYAKRYLPVMEMIGWSVFFIWLLNILFANSTYTLYLNFLVFILIFVFASWFFLRDFVAGVQVRSRFNLAKGQNIHFSMQSGEVRSLGLLALKVQTEQGSIMIIPYAKLDQEAIQLNLHEKGDSRTTFVIEIDKKKDIQETVKHIEELVINSPWCSHKTKPKVQILDETGNKIKYEISCQPNVSEGIKKLEMMLNQSFQK